MKKLKVLATSLVLLLPLLMANSPAPYPLPNDYTSFTNTAFVETQDPITYKYTYTTTITNIGTQFVPIEDINIYDDTNIVGDYYNSSLSGDILRQNESREITFTYNTQIAAPNLKVKAYQAPATGITYENIREFTKTESSEATTRLGRTAYKYTFLADVTGLKTNVFYQAVVTYKYAGNTFTGSIPRYSDFGFYSDVDMNFADIEIVEINFIQGRESGISNFINALVRFFLIVGGLILLAIIVPLIILTVVLVKRKKRKQAENQ